MGLTLAMFIDVLFSGNIVAGNQTTDLFSQFLAWRRFGFGELAKGHLALWNPHVYSGAPFFGGFQAALLYPPNWLFLVLPLAVAVNWSIALHVFLLGVFVFLWAKKHNLTGPAALLSGVLTMFCSAHFSHVFAGHLTNLCTMPWAPLVFLAIDGIFSEIESRAEQRLVLQERDPEIPASKIIGWGLLGAGALAMQIFAGHPQYVFYTGVAAAIYCALGLIRISRRGFAIAALALIPIGGGLLAAVQLLTGVQASSETVRSEALPFEFAAMFSLPPENLLTLIAPGFFGDMPPDKYFGRCYLWEMSLFIGVTGFVLAIYGAISGLRSKVETSEASNHTKNKKQKSKSRAPEISASKLENWKRDFRKTAPLVVMVFALLLLALGAHTPLFRVLYSLVPGFNKFRGISKFVFQASLFFALLAGTGFDRILKTQRVEKNFVVAVLAGGSALLIISFVIRAMDWQPVLRAIASTNESYLLPQIFANPGLANLLSQDIALAHSAAANSLALAALTMLALGGLFFALRHNGRAVWAIGALAMVEVFVYARSTRDSFDSTTAAMPEVRKFLDEHPGDYRVLNTLNPNSALLTGAFDLSGNDPGVVRRYAEFVAFTQGGDPNNATQYLNFARLDPLYAMLRLRYTFFSKNNQLGVAESRDPMPHVALVAKYRVLEKRDAIFAAMRENSFDPRAEIILEKAPPFDSRPLSREAVEGENSARIISSTTDSLDIEADLKNPALLLISDLYTPSWRARALEGSSQQKYELMPADYILRAVPLAAGHHHLRVEYKPRAFTIGAWISALSLAGYLAAVAWWWRKKPLP